MSGSGQIPANIKIIRAGNAETSSPGMFKELLAQLTKSPVHIDQSLVTEIIADNNTRLFLAVDHQDHDKLAGFVVIAIYRTFSARSAHIEDLVVDNAYQNMGIGRALMDAAIDFARVRKVNHVNLTCAPFRVAANQLYEKMGFKKRQTNVYSLILK